MTNEQLVTLVKAGENVADNMLQLWKQNENFIYKLALKYKGCAEIDDLNQEGYIGLCNAVEHYETDKGVLFLSYASYWIEQAMRYYINNCTGAIRVPVYARYEVQQYKKIANEYRKWYGREPSDIEMRDFLGVSAEKLETIKRACIVLNMRSLSEPVGGEDEELLLGDTIAQDENVEEDVIKKLDTATMKIELWKAVDELPDDIPEIIRCRYQRNMTLASIGDELGITRERVRQKEEKYLRKIRWENPALRVYYNQYLTNRPIRHVGVREFRRTWTSSTELAAIRAIYE